MEILVGQENMETLAKHESWFSTWLNWLHKGLKCDMD